LPRLPCLCIECYPTTLLLNTMCLKSHTKVTWPGRDAGELGSGARQGWPSRATVEWITRSGH
jgi:hypothetical protein